MGYQMVTRPMTSRDPQMCCEAVRSAILATAWLLVSSTLWTTRTELPEMYSVHAWTLLPTLLAAIQWKLAGTSGPRSCSRHTDISSTQSESNSTSGPNSDVFQRTVTPSPDPRQTDSMDWPLLSRRTSVTFGETLTVGIASKPTETHWNLVEVKKRG